MGVIGTVASNLVDAGSQKLFSNQVRGKFASGVGKMKDKNLADAVATAKKDLGGLGKDATEAEVAAAKEGLKLAQEAQGRSISDGITDMVGGVKDWFTAADAGSMGKGRTMTLAKRYGALAGGSVALGTTGRMMNGGTLTQDNRGRQDIAGIPFI